MNLGKYIFGIREEDFRRATEKERNDQFLSYNLLSAMYFILVIFSTVAGGCYGLLIFQDWALAIPSAILFGGICFVLLLLVLFLNLTTGDAWLYNTMTDMTTVFNRHEQEDLSHASNHQLHLIVESHEQEIRTASMASPDTTPTVSMIFVSIIKLTLLLIISCAVANGMELWMFQDQINESLSTIKTQMAPIQSGILNQWTQEMLDPPVHGEFTFIHCQSPLMTWEILAISLGPTKVLIDMLFYCLFLIPFILVRKSRQYAHGAYLREIAIRDISISYMSFLLTQRKCQQLEEEIKQTPPTVS